ncbi:MAG: efflux RND transporter periplasmic adaptor subunit [Methylobacter sp.]
MRAVIILLLLLSLNSYASESTIQISPEHSANLGVKLGKLEPATQIPLLSAPAKVVVPPTQEYVVSAAQTGVIEQLIVAVGDKVAKGQLLAQLNSPELLTLQREYLKAVSTLQLAEATFQRDKKLIEEGVIADRRWQETRVEYQSLGSEANEQKQLLEMAGMSANEIRQLAKTHKLTRQLNVYAPITGVVMERLAVAGTRIDMMAPLYRIANLDELWLEIAIPQERMDSVKLGNRVEVENTKVSASITLLGQSVNPENQTVLARAVVAKQRGNTVLRPGQRLNTRIIQSSRQAAFKIPNAAIAQNEGRAFIFIRTEQGFVVTPITVVGKQGDESIISGALSGTEDIAVQGAVALKANWLGLGGDE